MKDLPRVEQLKKYLALLGGRLLSTHVPVETKFGREKYLDKAEKKSFLREIFSGDWK